MGGWVYGWVGLPFTFRTEKGVSDHCLNFLCPADLPEHRLSWAGIVMGTGEGTGGVLEMLPDGNFLL